MGCADAAQLLLDLLLVSSHQHLGRALQGSGQADASDDEEDSPTCQAANLGRACCLTFTFTLMPFMLTMFLIIRCNPKFALISVALLGSSTWSLGRLMIVEYLRCVIALFIMCFLQFVATVAYLMRRYLRFGPAGWLAIQDEDRENPMARMVGNILGQAARNGQVTPGSGITAAIREARGESGSVSSTTDPSALPRYPSADGGGDSPALRRSRNGGSPQMRVPRASLSDYFGDLRDELSAKFDEAKENRHSRGGSGGADDANDPHHWSLAQLRAYLASTNFASGEAGVSLPREALVQRCCEVMGRQYRPKEGEAEAGLGDSFPEGGGGRRGGSRDGSRGVLGTTADALGEKAAGYDSGEEAGGAAERASNLRRSGAGAHGMPSRVGAATYGSCSRAQMASELGAQHSAGSFLRRAKKENPSFLKRHRDARAAARHRAMEEDEFALFERLERRSHPERRASRGGGGGDGSVLGGDGGGSPVFDELRAPMRREDAADDDSSDASSDRPRRRSSGAASGWERRDGRRASAERCSGSGVGRGTTSSPEPALRKSRRASGRGGDDTTASPSDSSHTSGHSSSQSGGSSSQTDSSSSVSADAAGRPSSGVPSMTPEEAEERLKRRQATAARAQERRQAAQERRSQAAAERKGAAAAAADAKASAASRVTNWAEGKDFFGMLQTLDAFGKLNLSTGVGTSRALEPGATPAAIKKAFHKASLSLHPDRLTALEPAQQIEAEELFKVLSAAFDVVRQQQAVTLQA